MFNFVKFECDQLFISALYVGQDKTQNRRFSLICNCILPFPSFFVLLLFLAIWFSAWQMFCSFHIQTILQQCSWMIWVTHPPTFFLKIRNKLSSLLVFLSLLLPILFAFPSSPLFLPVLLDSFAFRLRESNISSFVNYDFCRFTPSLLLNDSWPAKSQCQVVNGRNGRTARMILMLTKTMTLWIMTTPTNGPVSHAHSWTVPPPTDVLYAAQGGWLNFICIVGVTFVGQT